MTLQTSKNLSKEILRWDPDVADIYGAVTKNEKRKSRVVQELEEKRMREKLAEELECQKKFKAQSVPDFVHVPMYDEIVRQQEKRKLLVKKKGKEMLQNVVKPFSFTERESAKMFDKNQLLNKASYREGNSFRAGPFPTKLFDLSYEKKQQEQEASRKSANETRSKALLESSAIPKSILDHEKLIEKRGNSEKNIILDFVRNNAITFRPKINREVPNFDALHQQVLNKKSCDKNTKCVPFHFETERKVNKQQMNERKVSSASTNCVQTWRPLSSQCMTPFTLLKLFMHMQIPLTHFLFHSISKY